MFVLISIEIALRIAEKSYYFISDKLIKYDSDVDPDAYRIMCLGESTVQGGGASDYDLGRNKSSKSFPAQLKKLLDQYYPDRKIQVFNLGITGVNAKEI